MWTGQKDIYGYGVIKYHQKALKAHRVMMELTGSSVPQDKCVLHKCDNPGCVNPNHLYIGTQKDNAIDRSGRGRSGDVSGEKNGRAKLIREQVVTIREIYEEGKHTKRQLAQLYNVTETQIKHIVQNKQWKDAQNV